MGSAVQRSYRLEDVERGLRELAECRGNTRLASRRLEQRGLDVPFQRLHDWKQTHGARYAEVLAEVEDQVHQTIATEYETLALKGIQAQHVLIDDLLDKRDELSGKELATAINSTATSAGIATDKSSNLRGRPNVIIENRNPNELLQALGSMLRPYIEGSSEEIPDAELVSGEAAEGAVVAAARTDSDVQRASE